MDIPRPSQAKEKRRKRLIYSGIAVVALVVLFVLAGKLKPAAPSVERNLVWIDTVKQGQMLRQVRGLGTLVPEEIRWVAARTQGRVEKIILRPGALVQPDSVIVILTNPDVTQAAAAADSQLKAAEAEYKNLKVTLEKNVLDSESTAANAKANFEQARLKAEVNEQLFKDGLVSELDLRLSRVAAEQASKVNEIEQKRFAFTQESIAPQLAVKAAEVDRLSAQSRLRHEELDALQVRASMAGVLSALPVEVGAQVQPGANIARVADPAKLKAEIRIAETQAKDILIGQKAEVDTRNGVVTGHVARVEPAVQNGTVTIDVIFDMALPKGARPDLSVDGVIELERLENILYVGRPAFGQERSTVSIYRMDSDDTYATRTPVKLGRSSVNTIEILEGLSVGDKVILSDMSQYDTHDRVKLK